MLRRTLISVALIALVAGCAGAPEEESTQTQPASGDAGADAEARAGACSGGDMLADDERATGDPFGDVIDTDETGEVDEEETPC